MNTHSEQDDGRTIRSVEIAFSIIDVLQQRNTVGVTELADELGHSKSTVHSHLRTLEGQEVIVRDNGGYRLSIRILDIARHVREQVGNYDVIREEVEKLAEETGEVTFGIFSGVSDNLRRWYSIENARARLGYDPQDDAEEWDEPPARP